MNKILNSEKNPENSDSGWSNFYIEVFQIIKRYRIVWNLALDLDIWLFKSLRVYLQIRGNVILNFFSN